jgi:polysaccharide biosynthesis transport protein
LPILGALGLFLGFGLGIALALVADLLDSTFSSVEDLERAVGANVIAHVPRFNVNKLCKDLSPDSKVAPSVLSFHSPRSAESEIYRVARTSLLVSNRREAVRTIMNTSPQPGDGKSTTISNLAVSFARTGKRVLLIDADLRRPMISTLFGLDDQPGLTDVLLGKEKFKESYSPSELPNLYIMPNGLPTSQPAELLESHRFNALLNEAKENFDLILIDAPPLLAVTDPAIIAPLVDSVLITLRINKNGRRPVENAVRILHDMGVTPSAVIVNGVEGRANKSYGYGAYKGNQYGYVGQYHAKYSARAVDRPSDLVVGHLNPR